MVRAWFDAPEHYLERREFDIRIRRDAVAELTRGLIVHHMLDIGCGDGSISIPLLSHNRRLTLLDVSSGMLAIARANVRPSLNMLVEFVNHDLLEARLRSESFDLVLCLGVLAHVDSVAEVIAEMARVLRPGGSLLLEFTDSRHPWGRCLQRLASLPGVRSRSSRVSPPLYALNQLTHAAIVRLCQDNALQPKECYRYGHLPPGTCRLIGHHRMYQLSRLLFGCVSSNRNCWLGNEFIYRLEKAPAIMRSSQERASVNGDQETNFSGHDAALRSLSLRYSR